MTLTNYHSHSKWSDGKGELEDFVKEAINQKLEVYGFSEHAPVYFDCEWTMNINNFKNYSLEIDSLKLKYSDKIELLKGLEIDYLPNNPLNKKEYIQSLYLDYFIGAVHFVDIFENGYPWGIDTSEELFKKGLKEIFNNNIEKAVTSYYTLICDMIETINPPIVAHLDKIGMYNIGNKYYNTNDAWYKKIVNQTLNLISNKQIVLELNTRGFYKGNDKGFCPSAEILFECKKKNIPIMINSDCHEIKQITWGFEQAKVLLKDAGYISTTILKNGNYINHNL